MKTSVAIQIGLVLWGTGTLAVAQSSVVSGVYTCVDAQGRKLTSDRPIPECNDREQRVLNPSGTLKQTVGPTLTAKEQAAIDAKEKQKLEERNRSAEERRREKALLLRFPNKATHDKERAEALRQVNAGKQAASTRLTELAAQRVKLNEEMEFYAKDATKAPVYLRRQVEDNAQNTAIQQRIIAEQGAEIRRVNQRFDDELARLQVLWLTVTATPK
jgi:hypothetical protein